MTLRIALLTLLLLLTGCGALPWSAASVAPERVWDVQARRYISPAEAAERVARADYALLGETHDNARHQEIQLQLLARAAKGARPAVAFEQMDREIQAAVDAARTAGASAESVMAAAHVAASWTPALYRALVSFAIEHDLPIIAANYSRRNARALVAEGLQGVDARDAERLALAAAWSNERQATQRRLIVEGHCGQDDPVTDKLVVVQRMRDAVMADALLAVDRAVAIIGRGHARRDVGVPLYLAVRAPQRSVLSVGLVEIEEGKSRPGDYDDAAPGVHDLVWFTARALREDPCK